MKNPLNTEMKKGDPDNLNGRVTVYAKVDIDPAELITMKSAVASMVHGGLITVQGNYTEQNSLRDFLRNEMGITFDKSGNEFDSGEDGLKEMIDGMEGIESALDPKKLREKLQSMEELEDFIPTPAMMTPFNTEMEILAQEGDVYFAGTYSGIGNAVLAVNAVPIIYQALFREQQTRSIQDEISSLITQIENGGETIEQSIAEPGIDPEEKLLKVYIPLMLYQRVDKAGLTKAQTRFRNFMRGYRYNDDVNAVAGLISAAKEPTATEFKLLELYAKKIALVQAENFSAVESVHREIEKIKIVL